MNQDEFIKIMSQIYPDIIIGTEDKGHLKIVYFMHKDGKVESTFIVNNFEQIINQQIEHFTKLKSAAENALNSLNRKEINHQYIINKDLIFHRSR